MSIDDFGSGASLAPWVDDFSEYQRCSGQYDDLVDQLNRLDDAFKGSRRFRRGSTGRHLQVAISDLLVQVVELYNEGDSGYEFDTPGIRYGEWEDLYPPTRSLADGTEELMRSILEAVQEIWQILHLLQVDDNASRPTDAPALMRDHAPPPGHQVATQPVCPHGPPRQPAAPPEWATAGRLAA